MLDSCLPNEWMFLFSLVCSGEIFELKAELNSDKKEKKKEAVKKVIASMTVGKDVRYEGEMAKKIPPVSSLFSQNGLFLSQCSFPRCGKLHAD